MGWFVPPPPDTRGGTRFNIGGHGYGRRQPDHSAELV